uniref:Uncharacterized protein n=1 Tax=Acanthochromis polyacanthus TaxID=80966 RepID=A0A3Q1H089_9TELE
MESSLTNDIHRPNLTEEELKALKDLREDTLIVIKPADKGSATVIMDRTDDIYEALRQLNDTTYYIPLQKPIYQHTAKQISDILDTMTHDGLLTKKQATYIRGKDTPRPRYFYLLSIIHKPPETCVGRPPGLSGQNIPQEIPSSDKHKLSLSKT